MCNCIEKFKEEVSKEFTISAVKPLINNNVVGLNSISIRYRPWSKIALRHQLRWSIKAFRFKFCPFCGEKI
ncbi:hypothetical protein [Clostridium sp.]|jgi:hypothetical protein|uniref:hypothetical protein n=1 Tax=Clostridium sp. TaxID=1506 RepID=UPI00290311F3|nr:hypothetical protein [Clostridium sp.]MDU2157483.1 hypothetical protein [Clostridium sp.]